MALIEAIRYEDWMLNLTEVRLLHPDRPTGRPHETTLITGQNGSHKSSLLQQLVSREVRPREPDMFLTEKEAAANRLRHQVFCLSGSAADRFPSKEMPGGGHSHFDVPHYTYVGQRVANNLLSRKAPLERMLEFALHPRSRERCAWNFFTDAHAFAGIKPNSEYRLVAKGLNSESRFKLNDLVSQLRSLTPDDDHARNRNRQFPYVSFAMAEWLLAEFNEDDFRGLERLIGAGRWDVQLSASGATCDGVSPNLLRLGMHLGIMRLQSVTVHSVNHGASFSGFELSSGEFHMFSTILAIGFGLDADALLLLDEPENSLHPQWQRDLMSSVLEVCGKVMKGGHVIVCTHSPLIVGAALEGSTVVDMSTREPQLTLVPYGASSDELLLRQFGVASSRNSVVVDKVQQAVALVERGNFEHPEFLALLPDLAGIRAALRSDDPMVDIIDSLIGEGESR